MENCEDVRSTAIERNGQRHSTLDENLIKAMKRSSRVECPFASFTAARKTPSTLRETTRSLPRKTLEKSTLNSRRRSIDERRVSATSEGIQIPSIRSMRAGKRITSGPTSARTSISLHMPSRIYTESYTLCYLLSSLVFSIYVLRLRVTLTWINSYARLLRLMDP